MQIGSFSIKMEDISFDVVDVWVCTFGPNDKIKIKNKRKLIQINLKSRLFCHQDGLRILGKPPQMMQVLFNVFSNISGYYFLGENVRYTQKCYSNTWEAHKEDNKYVNKYYE